MNRAIELRYLHEAAGSYAVSRRMFCVSSRVKLGCVAAITAVLLTGCSIGGEAFAALGTSTPIATPFATQQANGSTPRATATFDIALSDAARDLRGYVGADNSGVVFIYWTESGNTLTGTLQKTYLAPNNRTGIGADTIGFTGVRSGKQMTLTFPQGFGLTTMLTGTFEDFGITLYVPDSRGTITPLRCYAGNAADYNRAVVSLRESVGQATAVAQMTRTVIDGQATQSASTAGVLNMQQERVQRANERLDEILRRLRNNTSTLKSRTTFSNTLSSYERNWDTMQRHNQQLRQDAAKRPFDCFQLSAVMFQLSSMESDRNSIKSNDDYLSSQTMDIQSIISNTGRYSPGVQQDIESARTAYAELKAAVAANITGSPSAQFGMEEVNKVIDAAQQQIDASNAAIKDAQGKGADYDKKAAQLLDTATMFVAGLKCS